MAGQLIHTLVHVLCLDLHHGHDLSFHRLAFVQPKRILGHLGHLVHLDLHVVRQLPELKQLGLVVQCPPLRGLDRLLDEVSYLDQDLVGRQLVCIDLLESQQLFKVD